MAFAVLSQIAVLAIFGLNRHADEESLVETRHNRAQGFVYKILSAVEQYISGACYNF